MKNYLTQFKFCFTLVLTIFAMSCSSEDDNSDSSFDGSERSIEEFVGEDIYNQLNEFGFNINEGNTPPNISGSFFADNLVILDSSVETDYIGMTISSQIFTFSNQDTNALTIDYNASGGSQSDTGSGSLIAGSGDNFLVLLINKSTISGYTADTLFAISGTMTEDGIENYQLAVFNQDNNDAPEGIFIPEGTGRVIHDTDDLADKK